MLLSVLVKMTELTSEYTFEETAILGDKGYNDFGINSMSARMYGHKPSDIVNLKLRVSENQVRPQYNEHTIEADYWGWFDFEENQFTMIYPQLVILHMCFAYGIKAQENRNRGRAYRLEVV
jgi:hypothetical protein